MLRTLVVFSLAIAALLPLGAPALAEDTTNVVANVPTSLPAGQTSSVPITLSNSTNVTWSGGAYALSYHWYNASGAVVWDGLRTALPTSVTPGTSVSINATVRAPSAGTYTLRFAIVQEGVRWLSPSTSYNVQVTPALSGSLSVSIASLSTTVGQSTSLVLNARNTGSVSWSASGVTPVRASYHVLDATGNVLVWDGPRSVLPSDVAVQATSSITLSVNAPIKAGSYTLVIDLVQDGVAWFGSSIRLPLVVADVTYVASWNVPSSLRALGGATITPLLQVQNTSNASWSNSGAFPTNVSYHISDASGRVLIWDGGRTSLGGDVTSGASASVRPALTLPLTPGDYKVEWDLVREGVRWFGSGASTSLRVDRALDAGYGATTTPSSALAGSNLQVQLTAFNTGGATWMASGTKPVHASYHISDAGGNMLVWDGARASLRQDVPPGGAGTFIINVALPTKVGVYAISWDLVQEGVTWFSAQGVVPKRESIALQPAITFNGHGNGHGIGLSQYGALGWATGVTGTVLTGEQIVSRYYPGTSLATLDFDKTLRVLISAPSTSCTSSARLMDTWVTDVTSTSSFTVMDERSSTLVAQAPANNNWQIAARSGLIEVWDNTITPRKVWSGTGPVTLNGSAPIKVAAKGLSYRGTLRFSNNTDVIRLVNEVRIDDYLQGVVPLEMPSSWHPEALKAQTYAARSYGVSSIKSGAWDVRDDTYDQCYGGVEVEKTTTNTAILATSNRVITYNGSPIRAFFASSNGGSSEGNGCVWGVVKSSNGYVCGSSLPYLRADADPADLATSPHANWSVTLGGSDLAAAASRLGANIGTFASIDASNVAPGGHVISVRVYGSNGSAEFTGEAFLRGQLGLRSTRLRIAP